MVNQKLRGQLELAETEADAEWATPTLSCGLN
jgi:hypothetical protein